MFTKIISTLAVFALISSSQADFREDSEAFLKPWVNGLLSTKPLVDLTVENIRFMQNETMGMDSKLLEPMYQNTHKQLLQLEAQMKSKDSRACVKDLVAMLTITTDKFRMDGTCLQKQKDLAESIVVRLIKSVFPVEPTPACPIPVLCKFEFYNPRSIRQVVAALKDVHKHALDLLKFIVYFKKNIAECRRDVSLYKAMISPLLKMGQLCSKI